MRISKGAFIKIIQSVVLLGVIPALAWAFGFGARHGVTTAPGDHPGTACTVCHRGTALNGGGGNVSVSFPNGLVYTPGQAQTLTVTVTDSAAVAWGFQMTARPESDPMNQQAGNFIAGANQKVICSDDLPEPAAGCANNGIQWLGHSTPLSSNTFTVQWTPPATNVGNIHLYLAANAAGSGPQPAGDHIYSADYLLLPPPLSGGSAPVANAAGVVNAASGSGTIQSGSFVSIYGTNFTTAAATAWDGAIRDTVLPTTVSGVSVTIDDKQARIAYVDSHQINALLPTNTNTGQVNVVVSNPYGSSSPVPVSLAVDSPAFFTFSQNARYIAAQIAIPGPETTTYEYLAPEGLFGASTPSRPAKPGEIIVLYGTGFGPTDPPVDPTLVFAGAAPTAKPVAVTIGGQPATVQFAGVSGAGLYQLNVVVPDNVPNGDQAVVATTAAGTVSPQTVYVPIQR